MQQQRTMNKSDFAAYTLAAWKQTINANIGRKKKSDIPLYSEFQMANIIDHLSLYESINDTESSEKKEVQRFFLEQK